MKINLKILEFMDLVIRSNVTIAREKPIQKDKFCLK